MIFILPANDWAAIIKDILVDSTWGKSRVNKIWTKIFFSETHIQWFTWFCYVLMISLDHKNVRFSHLFQMCSKSISNDIIRFSPFCSNENMRFSYILIILSECNKSRWSLQILLYLFAWNLKFLKKKTIWWPCAFFFLIRLDIYLAMSCCTTHVC